MSENTIHSLTFKEELEKIKQVAELGQNSDIKYWGLIIDGKWVEREEVLKILGG